MPIIHAEVPNPHFVFHNDGPTLVSCDFWDTAFAQTGLCFLSLHAGVGRLLLPPAQAYVQKAMMGAHAVLITLGEWEGHPNSAELMWEDGRIAPFCLMLCPTQIQGPMAVGPNSRLEIHTYVRGGDGRPIRTGEWPAGVRVAETLPYRRSWGL